MNREKRQHLRLDTEIPCAVHLPSGDILSAVIVNLSTGGLKFSCGRDTAHQILPREQRTPGQVTGVVIEVHFGLQLPAHQEITLNAMVRVIHSERLAQNVFHVGVQFISSDDAAVATVKGYIDANKPQQQV